MFAELVLKELRDHLLSLRFQIGLLLALVLVSASAFVLSAQHGRELREFFQRQQQTDDFLSKYSHLNRVGGVLQVSPPPSAFVLVQGLPDPANAQTLDSNPMLDLFRPVDLTSAVAFIFSLLGIVLGFDAVNGEKECGTLRLLLANRLRRFAVLSAKWAGGMLVMVVALLAAWLAATTVVLVQSGTHWAADDALSLITLWVFSLLYCGAFFTLALAFSTLSSRSSVSVLASLFTWVLLVFVLPNISPYVAAQIVRVPSLAALQRDLQYITSEQRDDLGREGVVTMLAKFGCVSVTPAIVECPRRSGGGGSKFTFEFGDLYQPSETVKHQIGTDADFRQLFEQLAKENEQVWAEVNRKQEAKATRLRGAWQVRADAQFNVAKRLSYTSPLPPFVYASTDLALTGLMSRRWFDQQTGPYYEALEKYLWARFHAEQAKNPAFSINDFLDIRTRPRFTFVPPPFVERLAELLPFGALLGSWNLAFFTLALFAFLRFDVR
jgi:ABC-type transport system involved in multi-copper enzyme maturation permease subunit